MAGHNYALIRGQKREEARAGLKTPTIHRSGAMLEVVGLFFPI